MAYLNVPRHRNGHCGQSISIVIIQERLYSLIFGHPGAPLPKENPILYDCIKSLAGRALTFSCFPGHVHLMDSSHKR